MRTFHFLRIQTSWSLLFRREVGQAIISTHDQLQPGEIDGKTTTIRGRGSGGTRRFVHRSADKFWWVQDGFEPTESDDDMELKRENTDSVKTVFDPNNTKRQVSMGIPSSEKVQGKIVADEEGRIHTHHCGSGWTMDGGGKRKGDRE
jgi:hypothetical protein